MSDTELAAEILADQAQRFSAFMGVTKPEPSDIFVLVMGRTGSGKSTFISRCTGKPAVVGHGLNSCTKSIDVFSFMHNDRRVYLVDTPGFNDTSRPDIETLEILGTYLGASYANGVRIHGLILLHPISDNRMAGSSLRNIQMIKAVYGCTSYNNLAIVTTMWPRAPSCVEAKSLGNREDELLVTERYFGALIAKGATKFRYNETGCRNSFSGMASAQDIVNHLITRLDASHPSELQLQRELIIEKKTLGETAAGIAVAERLSKARQNYNHELKGLKSKLKSHLAKVNGAHISMLQEQKVEVDRKLKKVEHGRRALSKTMDDLCEEEERVLRGRIENVDKQLREQLLAQEQALGNMENLLREICEQEIQRGRARRSPEPNQQQEHQDEGRQEIHAQHPQKNREQEATEKKISDLRREIAKTRQAYRRFHGQTSNVWDGTMNGIAAGATSGIVGVLLAVMCIVM